MSKSLWTDEKVEQAKEMRDKGASAGQIGRILGFTRNAILGKLHRIGHVWFGEKNRTYPKKLAGDPSRPRKARGRKRRPPVSSDSPAPPLPPTPVHERLTILQVCNGKCRFPLGEPEDDDFGFCGRATTDGAVYCQEHMELCSHPSAYEAERLAPRW